MNKSCPCCEWISIKEQLPEISEPVLISTNYGKMATAYLDVEDGWMDWMRPQHGYGSVTHWMPLPSIEGLEK